MIRVFLLIAFFCGFSPAKATPSCRTGFAAVAAIPSSARERIKSVLSLDKIRQLDEMDARFRAISDPNYDPELEGLSRKEISDEFVALAPVIQLYYQFKESLTLQIESWDERDKLRSESHALDTEIYDREAMGLSTVVLLETKAKLEQEKKGFYELADSELENAVASARELVAALNEYQKRLAASSELPSIAVAYRPRQGNIAGFKDSELEEFYNTTSPDAPQSTNMAGKFPWSMYAEKVLARLHLINDCVSLKELKDFGGKDLKKYKEGKQYANYYAIEVDKQWRILFRWEEGHAFNIFIANYHNE